MPLATRTVSEYRAALRRLGAPVDSGKSFGALAEAHQLPQAIEPEEWQHLTNSGRLVLRAAVRWAYKEAGQEAYGAQVAEQIKLAKEVRRVKKNPTRADVDAFLAAVKNYPAPWRELLLVNVAVGFRRDEVLSLDRTAVENALRHPEKILRFVRKGSLEHELPIGHVAQQFKALLRQPVLLGRKAQLHVEAPEWEYLWQVIGSSYRSAYERLKRNVAKIAREAGCSTHWTPHVMRHAFASEMARDGASLPAIQEALNHSSYQTSLRYIHVDARDLQKWMKPRDDK